VCCVPIVLFCLPFSIKIPPPSFLPSFFFLVKKKVPPKKIFFFPRHCQARATITVDCKIGPAVQRGAVNPWVVCSIPSNCRPMPRLSRRARTAFSSARTMRAIRKFRTLKFKKIVPHIFDLTLGPLQIRNYQNSDQGT